MSTPRSWLFAPGHNEKLLGRVFEVGADAVLLDLEDGVPDHLKDRARDLVAEVAAARPCWVRVNKPLTDACARDLEALAGKAAGLRLPKVESAADIEWAAERAPGTQLDCTIETARGVVAVNEIAMSASCASLSYGGLDLALDLGIGGGELETLFARSAMVVAARAAGKPPPSDGVHAMIDDDVGLRLEAEAARRLGFFGKSAIHPRQVPIINEVFTPRQTELDWADRVLAAFKASGGAATQMPNGEFVDTPVAERALQLLRRHQVLGSSESSGRGSSKDRHAEG
jgi:citrate lyase subunit beta/citryl-CoA lyase